MMEELRKRPMARPLAIWIIGILLQVNFHIGNLSLFLLFIPLTFVCLSYFATTKIEVKYPFRWVWGINYLVLLLFLSIQFTVFTEGKKELIPKPERVSQTILQIREQLLEKIDQLDLSTEQKSVLATITLGYRKELPKRIREQFAVTGTAHILAVSGMHVGIIMGFISFLLRLIPFIKRRKGFICFLVLVIVWLYVLITGAAASAVRAGWMLSFYITGRWLGKNRCGYNSLLAAAFCMLVFNPSYFFDIGFQLSFIAVFFMLYLEPFAGRIIKVRNPLVAIPLDWVKMGCMAQIGVTLLSVYYFESVTLLFLFTAVPVMLLVTCLLPLSVLWILWPEVIPGFSLLKNMVETGTCFLTDIIENFSYSGIFNFSFSLTTTGLLLSYFLLIVFIEYFRKKNRLYLQKNPTFEV